jgi:homoserine dehydrogenase
MFRNIISSIFVSRGAAASSIKSSSIPQQISKKQARTMATTHITTGTHNNDNSNNNNSTMTPSTSTTSSQKQPLRIGMFGGGTVGGGVYELLNAGSKASGPNPAAVVTHICVRDLHKPRDFIVDTAATQLTVDFASILDNPDIDCVVEVMGGTDTAKTVILSALRAGKSVVTANKALLAEHYDEIVAAAAAGAGKGNHPACDLAFEAAVCGGIPIIHLLQSSYTADTISSISGICNGTTNFMLCKMQDGEDYGAVLKEAQDLGYAEADPAADVEGWDVRAKISLLSQLAFGQTVSPVENIPCRGITSITSVDFEYAAMMKATIKMVGTAAVNESTGALSVFVSPAMVGVQDLLATAVGSGNAVKVTSANLGTVAYTGPGAGRFPTANSVVADIYRVAAKQNPGLDTLMPSSDAPKRTLDLDYQAKFYIRIPYQDGLGIIRSVGALAEKHGVSIDTILQNPVSKDSTAKAAASFCVTTDVCAVSAVAAMCAEIVKQNFSRGEPVYMPLQLEE